MKAIIEVEDAIIGIICGVLLLGYAGKYFSLKLNPYVYIALFVVFIFFILLDIVNEVKDLSTHFGLIVLSLIHDFADLVISLSFISYFAKWNIPYVASYLVPYLKNEAFIGYIGMFLIIANVVWFFLFPFAT